MTQKREQILTSALEMFSIEGYDATSTSRVAKSAGVSEGLIFRHFSNKEGLLNALLQRGSEMIQDYVSFLSEIDDPSERLESMIDMTFDMSDEHKRFWRLVYSLKWQADTYDSSLSDPMRKLCKSTFRDLGYKKPKIETEVFMILMDGMMTSILLRRPKKLKAISQSLKGRFGL